MTVRVNKPAVNLREELADLRKPTGIAGEAMLRAETPQEQFNLIGAGRRNAIINGGLNVWQRGVSFTGANGYTADRIVHTNYSGASPTVTKVAGTGNFPNAIQFTNINGGAGQQIEVEQRIEGLDLPDSGDLTLSFWVRGSKYGEVRTGRIINGASGVTNTGAENINITTLWQKVSIKVTSVAATESQYYRVFLMDGALSYFSSTSVWLEFTGVQLELGKVATPFEHRSYGEELALCQRFFERQTGIDGIGVSSNATTCYGGALRYNFKRVTPTISIRDSGGTANKITWNTAGVSGENVISTVSSTTISATRPYTTSTISARNSFVISVLDIDAEL